MQSEKLGFASASVGFYMSVSTRLSGYCRNTHIGPVRECRTKLANEYFQLLLDTPRIFAAPSVEFVGATINCRTFTLVGHCAVVIYTAGEWFISSFRSCLFLDLWIAPGVTEGKGRLDALTSRADGAVGRDQNASRQNLDMWPWESATTIEKVEHSFVRGALVGLQSHTRGLPAGAEREQ